MSVEVANETVGAAGSLVSLLPMVAIFVIFYFFLIRPQLKKQRSIEAMISELKKGDKVFAAGGLSGTIHKIEDNMIVLEIAENVRINALKSSVTEVVNKDNKKLVVEAQEEKVKAKKHKKAE
jgi:preprotein translocase subunit YajC